MTKLRFYEHFAVAYGTIWLILMLLAVCTASHINAGPYGLFGFPILALIYAFVRRAQSAGTNDKAEPPDSISCVEDAHGNPRP